jgi:NTP pyrophosphatase (non-canonical NTP hydrolase)
MDFESYQEKSKITRFETEGMSPLPYWALALNGEAGEVAEKVKKIYRDDDGEITEKRRKAIKKELGDCLWYLSQVATDLDLSLDNVAAENIKKLLDRQKRGALHGDGDDR